MNENKDYVSHLNKARKKRNQKWDPRYLLLAIVVVLLIGLGVLAAVNVKSAVSGKAARKSDNVIEEPGTGLEAASASNAAREEEEKAKEEQEIQSAIDAYQNLGIVQVSGYVNIRETPDMKGNIIGKVSGDGACEVLGEEGEWSHITSGGIEGYISSQYLVTGEEAKELAKSLVKKRAIIMTENDNLNIRSGPSKDAEIVGQALPAERYEVLSEADGWVEINSGYISADYCEVKYALNEGRKLDLKAQAINQYDNLVIFKKSGYMNVRSTPENKGDDNVIGKLTSKAAGDIIETLDGWYKIKSGTVTGYIAADPELIATGQEAKDLAMQNATQMAIITTDVLNVRVEPNTDSKIWTQIVKDERYPVVDQQDGWVQIDLGSVDTEDGSQDGDEKAYISTRDNNVEVRYALNEAIKFTPAKDSSSGGSSGGSGSSTKQSRRSQLVNYALQFVGNRYVWGGTSLTNGVDCSGFTMRVMEKFGVSLPHYSGSQAQMGKKVTSATMKPGDLIFYAGSNGKVNHVAIYIGNGRIVHAASRRSGIKTSTWNYRTPVAIRSMLD
ncbi:hydrolase Nlp/P60 [Clostridium sp. TM06-18]|mgnify:FL=1|jgi:cell wall-associated NlpC family hydrolase/SH3-like domain-containing protein|nr:SH3 domain-containing protein [Clostridium sp. TM06-18]RHU32651.1 hydrolase Nlp/P60 [Clostridium sp. TM06-18]